MQIQKDCLLTKLIERKTTSWQKSKSNYITLTQVGKVLNSLILRDKIGHPYIWDPRYKYRESTKNSEDYQNGEEYIPNVKGKIHIQNSLYILGNLIEIIFL